MAGASLQPYLLATDAMNPVGRLLCDEVATCAGGAAIAVFGWLMASVFEPRLRHAMSELQPDAARELWAQRDKAAAIQMLPGIGSNAAHGRRDGEEAFVAGYRWILP